MEKTFGQATHAKDRLREQLDTSTIFREVELHATPHLRDSLSQRLLKVKDRWQKCVTPLGDYRLREQLDGKAFWRSDTYQGQT